MANLNPFTEAGEYTSQHYIFLFTASGGYDKKFLNHSLCTDAKHTAPKAHHGILHIVTRYRSLNFFLQ